MPRNLGTNLDSDVGKQTPSPRWLVEFDLSGGTVRYATGKDASGSDISWGGNTYTARIFTVQVEELGGGEAKASFTFNTDDLVALATFLTAENDIACRCYLTAALNSYAGADDVVEIFNGYLSGGYRSRRGQISFDAERTYEMFPLWHVNAKNGFNFYSAPGEYQFPGGTLVLERRG